MSRDNLFIIHFQPLELYPPIQNLLIILNEYPHSKKIKTITTNQNGFSDFYLGQTEKNEIIRKDVHSENRFFRFLNFLNFYVFTYFKLIKEKPKQNKAQLNKMKKDELIELCKQYNKTVNISKPTKKDLIDIILQ